MKTSILHIGKTGGTALRSALRGLKKEKGLIFHGHAVTLKKIWKKAPKRNVVFGVRDPLTRYVSGFNSRLREGKPRHTTAWSPVERAAFSVFTTPSALAEALTSRNALEKAAAEMAMLGIRHVNRPLRFHLGPTDQLRARDSSILFVYRVESLDEDFKILTRLLGITSDVSLPTDEFTAHRTPSDMPTDLSDTARANLRRWYQDDIELYEFCSELHDRRVRAL